MVGVFVAAMNLTTCNRKGLMNEDHNHLIDNLRQLMPFDMLCLARRRPTLLETRTIAERQANLMLHLLDIAGPGAEVELLAEIPGITVRFTSGVPPAGTSVWTDTQW